MKTPKIRKTRLLLVQIIFTFPDILLFSSFSLIAVKDPKITLNLILIIKKISKTQKFGSLDFCWAKFSLLFPVFQFSRHFLYFEYNIAYVGDRVHLSLLLAKSLTSYSFFFGQKFVKELLHRSESVFFLVKRLLLKIYL